MIAALAWLAGAALAAPAPQRPVPYLWASAAAPAGWEQVRDKEWRPRGARSPAITVLFLPGASAVDWTREQAEPSAFTRKVLRYKEVRAGRVERRGAWTLVEVVTTGSDGVKTTTLDAALPAPGGIYALSYWGREPEYSRRKAQALAFLDSFKRMPPFFHYAALELPGKFSVDVPTGSWANIVGDSDVDVRAVAPLSPGGEAPGLLSVTDLGPDKEAPGRFLADACAGGASRAGRVRGRSWLQSESVTRERARLPEAPPNRDETRRNRCAVLQSGGRAYGVWWTAPPSAYDYGLPAFQRAVDTLRPAR